MCKSELISKIAKKYPQFSKKSIEDGVTIFFQTLTAELVQGNRIELRGFGTFSLRQRKARRAHNPSTHQMLDIPAKKMPMFRAGKELRDYLKNPSPEVEKKQVIFASFFSSLTQ
jgi:integration host factor beta subunit